LSHVAQRAASLCTSIKRDPPGAYSAASKRGAERPRPELSAAGTGEADEVRCGTGGQALARRTVGFFEAWLRCPMVGEGESRFPRPPGWSEGTGCHRHTVGRVIPCRVASPQSPTPFHPASGAYRGSQAGSRPGRGARVVIGSGRETRAAAVSRQGREGKSMTSDGPRLPVRLVTVRVPQPRNGSVLLDRRTLICWGRSVKHCVKTLEFL
jgi:hypothetical protein